MQVLNIGSLNIDIVYRVPHIVHPGETLSAYSVSRHAGGKGLNQSVALARAGGFSNASRRCRINSSSA
ncbi:MAG: hypothetical protein E7055_08480 [Lentisphaerae bacterium]|nr:hypothetical protein [Lentisphaerota bacterium]